MTDILSDAPEGEIVNRVAESAIATVDLAALWDGAEIVELDLAPWLHRGLVLRERDFRQSVKEADWGAYAGEHVAVFCSTDAIVPTWAYMVIAAKLDGVATSVAAGRAADLRRDAFVRAIDAHDWSAYADRPVVLKGCGNDTVPLDAFLLATQKLQGVAAKLMYGEACSAVPVWRRPPAGAPTAGAATRSAGLPPKLAKAVTKPAGPPKRLG